MKEFAVIILFVVVVARIFAKDSGDTCFVRQDHVFQLVNEACVVVNGKISNCVSARVKCDAP